MSGFWDQLVDCVCRPPRDVYTDDDLLGQRKGAFAVYQTNGSLRKCYRLDVELVNKRGRKLQCSHFKPNVVPSADGKLPCVVFCHCNSGSRRDAEEAIKELVPRNITVFCMDFEGSGLSEGDWVTLGANEVEDLTVVVEYLRGDESTSYIGLWGRSMGAVTALLYSKRDPTIAGMVLDSPFSRLTDLMMELVDEQKIRIPKAMLKMAITMLRRSVKKRAGFNIEDVAPIDHVHESFIPALFAHGQHDTFIKLHHSQRLYEAYAGQKEMRIFEGDHNDPRPSWFTDSAYIFFHFQFQMDTMPLLPHFEEYAPPSISLQHTPRVDGNDSSSSSDDLQIVDPMVSARHGQPMRLPGNSLAAAALEELQAAGGVGGMDDDAALQAALLASLEESTPERAPYAPMPEDDDEQLKQAIEASLRDAAPISPQPSPQPTTHTPPATAEDASTTAPAYYISPEEPPLTNVRRNLAAARVPYSTRGSVPHSTTTATPRVTTTDTSSLPPPAADVRQMLQRDSLSSAGGDEAWQTPSTDEWGLQQLHLEEEHNIVLSNEKKNDDAE